MKVIKFGGSSVADATQIRKVCDIVLSDPERRVVVVSAPGKRSADDTKVTDLLIRCAECALAGEDVSEARGAVLSRFESIATELQLADTAFEAVRNVLDDALAADTAKPGPFMDGVKAVGEDGAARLIAEALRQAGGEAQYVNPGDAGMLLSDEFGNAQLLPEAYDTLSGLRDRDGVTVFPGFFGYTREGQIVTFARGGSDITGAIVARAVEADVYENFTDVDSVLAADPRIIPDAQPIAELTFQEMRELAYAGFSVLHDEALVPVVQASIPVNIRNTNVPDAPGTWIRTERDQEPVHGVISGIASAGGFCTIYLSSYMMNRQIGFGRKLLQILEEEGLSYEHMPSGIDNISVIVREDSFGEEQEAHVVGRIVRELDVESVCVERGLSLIMVVGEGMSHTVGMAARATGALQKHRVNIEMMNQGSSEISMMFGVNDADRPKAVAALYEAFFSAP